MKMSRLIIQIAIGLVINFSAACKDSGIKKKMESEGIVPDSIDEAPSAKLTVIFPNNKEVNFGEELTPTEVKDKPSVSWEANPEKYYVLAMIDPDTPSRAEPTYREVNHWLVGNIKGNDVASGEIIADFTSSGPPKGTGLHRYIFLVYEQKQKLTFDEPRSYIRFDIARLNFSIRNFSKKYDLIGPIAGNYFQSQWDSYVEENNMIYNPTE